MKIEHINLFIQVVESGSINQAAKHNFITQQGLSQTLKQIESELGIALFLRSHKGMQLTPEGEKFYRYGTRAVQAYNDFLKDLPLQDADNLFDEVSRICFDLAKNNGTTVIFATETPRYAFGFGDRTMVLVDGSIMQVGTYQEMYSAPTTVWSAQAVDECYNTIKGTLTYENERLTFTSTPLNSVFTLDDEGKVVWEDKELYKVITLDVTHLKDNIVDDYIGKDVILGWHGKDFVFDDNGLEIEATFIKNLNGKIALQGDYDYSTLSVVVDDTPDNRKLKKIKFLPKVENALFFTLSENSIMKRKRQ